ncbi:hypothetical protein GCM10008090_34590 [Arenicella chitinivorans]|uniref:XdhC family protein n=1 Tax=Arenicella chitinivorans TaxID=1329800 RepID=A0A918VSV7_9GAMM|nr:XdhC family protein [Arenicella chitinivorans]GHA21753.1 hypothetical protein GCM10008090_34590 [Arenicella chitinivorans]
MLVNRTPSPRELLTQTVQTLEQVGQAVLATLVHIEGNAPYPVGTQMLIRPDGHFYGQLTGGCAERAIADQALLVLHSGQNQVHRYGLDSPFFDIQLPCGSGIDVYFDCQLALDELRMDLASLERRLPVTRSIERITKHYLPTPRVMLFGQGPIMLGLTRLALASGFDVICCAQNDATQNLLGEHDIIVESFGRAADLLSNIDPFTAVVSLFHEHDLEVPILAQTVHSKAFYLGALGSRRTHRERLAKLTAHGIDESLSAKINGPVGLAIGATTPEQIAVSILAEVIAQMNAASKE